LCVERCAAMLLAGASAWHRITDSPRGAFLLGVAGFLWTIVIVLAGCALFRARSFDDALTVLSGVLHLGQLDYGTFATLGLASFEILLLGVHIVMLFAIDFLIFARPDILAKLRAIRFVAIAAAVLLFYDIMLFGVFEKMDFIYFEF
jgi:alginate O-acetyltransferase complex protein AlgI